MCCIEKSRAKRVKGPLKVFRQTRVDQNGFLVSGHHNEQGFPLRWGLMQAQEIVWQIRRGWNYDYTFYRETKCISAQGLYGYTQLKNCSGPIILEVEADGEIWTQNEGGAVYCERMFLQRIIVNEAWGSVIPSPEYAKMYRFYKDQCGIPITNRQRRPIELDTKRVVTHVDEFVTL